MKTRYEKHHDQEVMWTVEFYFKQGIRQGAGAYIEIKHIKTKEEAIAQLEALVAEHRDEADLEICCINKITTQCYWRCEK